MSIIKMANDQKEKDELNKGAVGAASVAGMGGGVKLMDMSRDGVTGLERMHHSTDAANVDSIKESGLKSSLANKSHASQGAGIASIPGSQGKVYLGRNRGVADGVAIAQMMQNPEYQHANLRVNVPYEDLRTGVLKTVDNPELRGLKSKKDFADYLILRSRNPNLFDTSKKGMSPKEDAKYVKEIIDKARENGELNDLGYFETINHEQAEGAFKGLSKDTVTVDGDVDSKYIKGGKGNKGMYGIKDWGRYVKNNKGRFARNLGVGGLGVSGVGLGGYGLYRTAQDE